MSSINMRKRNSSSFNEVQSDVIVYENNSFIIKESNLITLPGRTSTGNGLFSKLSYDDTDIIGLFKGCHVHQ